MKNESPGVTAALLSSSSARTCASEARIATVAAGRPNSAIRTAASPCWRRLSTEGRPDKSETFGSDGKGDSFFQNRDHCKKWTGYNFIYMATQSIRLTEMAHGGGCGCKLSPAVLSQILAKMPLATGFE